MRFWFNLIFLLAIAFAVVAGAQLYFNDPVHIVYRQWSVTPPASIAAIALLLLGVAVFAAVRLLIFVLFIGRHISAWRQQYLQKKNYQTLKHIIALSVHGEKEKLLKTLPQLEKEIPQSVWQYAQAAGDLGKTELKMKWLEKATKSSDAIITTAAKAELCLLKNHLVEADSILKSSNALSGPYLLVEIYYRCCKARKDWKDALRAANRLREYRANRWDFAVAEAIQMLLGEVKTASEAHAIWKESVSGSEKKNPKVLALYIAALAAVNDPHSARAQLETAYKQHPHHLDILEQVVRHTDMPIKQQAFADNEPLATHNNIRLLGILVTLAEQLDLPGKAEQYRQRVKLLNASQTAA